MGLGVVGLLLVACSREPTAHERVQQAVAAIASHRYVDAVAALDGIEKVDVGDQLDACELLRMRMLALAGAGRRDESLLVAGQLGLQCGSCLDAALVARTGDLILSAGGRPRDLDPLLQAAASLDLAARAKLDAYFESRRVVVYELPETSDTTMARLRMISNCDFGCPPAASMATGVSSPVSSPSSATPPASGVEP